ncbi:hypothetical protein Q3G72_009003 [Acer saccharum]|nr:hypothetical protein Q3G72_009003 [Acer saccharum]
MVLRLATAVGFEWLMVVGNDGEGSSFWEVVWCSGFVLEGDEAFDGSISPRFVAGGSRISSELELRWWPLAAVATTTV